MSSPRPGGIHQHLKDLETTLAFIREWQHTKSEANHGQGGGNANTTAQQMHQSLPLSSFDSTDKHHWAWTPHHHGDIWDVGICWNRFKVSCCPVVGEVHHRSIADTLLFRASLIDGWNHRSSVVPHQLPDDLRTGTMSNNVFRYV